MRIGYFVWEYPPRIVGGLGTYAENICPEIRKSGHDINLFTPNDGSLKTREKTAEGIDVNRPKVVSGSGSEILSLFSSEELKGWGAGIQFFDDVLQYNILSATKFVNQLIDEEGHEFDIISAHDWLDAMAMITIKKKTGLPSVFHLHSTEWGRTMNNGSQTVERIERRAAEAADGVITVSEAMKKDLIAHGFDGEKIRVVYNGIDSGRYNPANLEGEKIQKLRNRYAVYSGDKMILFIGRMTGVKGVENLVKAMPAVISRHSEAKLVILGKGELEQKVLDLINWLNIGNNVKTRFEFVKEKERILHYGACDLFVAPSLYEPFGIIALEAMAMEKPVVVGASGVSGLREQVIHIDLAGGAEVNPESTGVHVDGHNSGDIAWGINRLLDDPKAAEEMGKRGRRRAQEHFSWDRIAQETIKVYKDIIKEVKAKKVKAGK